MAFLLVAGGFLTLFTAQAADDGKMAAGIKFVSTDVDRLRVPLVSRCSARRRIWRPRFPRALASCRLSLAPQARERSTNRLADTRVVKA